MAIKKLSEKYSDYIIQQRRFFHQYPELSLEESFTTAKITEELENIGLEIESLAPLQGVMGILKGAKPGKCILLRADIDGLPVQEETELPFQSKNQGKMHACGHDAHIAMQLGAAKILYQLKDKIPGTIKFYFQSGEELAKGAKEAIEHGFLEGIDACYGTHVWGGMPSKTVSIQEGDRMASCDRFQIRIQGKAAHGSAPHMGNDALVCACSLILNLQTLVSRRNDPLNALVLTIGTIQGGDRFNVVADTVEMDGTLRTFSREFRKQAEKMIREIIEASAAMYGCKGELFYDYTTGAVINDQKELVDIGQQAAVKLFGENILQHFEKITGSEDFSFLQEKIPGIYTFTGIQNDHIPGSMLPNHHEKFTIDEQALPVGAAIAAQFAYDYLQKKAKEEN